MQMSKKSLDIKVFLYVVLTRREKDLKQVYSIYSVPLVQETNYRKLIGSISLHSCQKWEMWVGVLLPRRERLMVTYLFYEST